MKLKYNGRTEIVELRRIGDEGLYRSSHFAVFPHVSIDVLRYCTALFAHSSN